MRVLTKSDVGDLFADNLAWIEVRSDQTRIINYATRILEVMFGYFVPGELEGKLVEKLMPASPAHTQATKDFLAFITNPTQQVVGLTYRMEGRKKDGTTFPIQVTLSPRAVGRERVVVVVVTDLTPAAVVNLVGAP